MSHLFPIDHAACMNGLPNTHSIKLISQLAKLASPFYHSVATNSCSLRDWIAHPIISFLSNHAACVTKEASGNFAINCPIRKVLNCEGKCEDEMVIPQDSLR